jgi:hypothetical protein
MRAIHVDYASLSKFEQGLRDSVLPFYAYTSRIGKFVFDELSQRPGGQYSQALRALDKTQTSDQETYVPASIRDRVGLPISPDILPGLESFAQPGPGLQRFVTNIDFPGMAAVNLPASVKGADGNVDWSESILNTAQNVGSNLAPHLRTAAELISGQDLYRKQPLGTTNTALDEIVGATLGAAGAISDPENFRLPPVVNTGAQMLMPGAGRVINAARQTIDRRIEDPLTRLGQAAWNQVGPVRFAIVDQARQDSDAVRQIDDILSRSPYAFTLNRTVVSQEDFDKMPPELQQLVLLKRSIEADQRKRRKAADERAAKLSMR